jgi:hypothetical protein
MERMGSNRFRVYAREQPEHNMTGEPALERTGAWVAPNRWVLQVEGEDRGMGVDGMLYFKDPQAPDGKWHGIRETEYPGFTPMPPLLNLANTQLVGQETVDGIEVYRIMGQTQDDPALRIPAELDVELLVRKADFMPIRMTILNAYKGVTGGLEGTLIPLPTRADDSMTIDYYDSTYLSS